MSMGQGLIILSSHKQVLNTQSSTDTEVVAVDDKLSQIIWTKYFLDEQEEILLTGYSRIM